MDDTTTDDTAMDDTIQIAATATLTHQALI
jgi:hypothetical protein